jgi:hypothetical protein
MIFQVSTPFTTSGVEEMRALEEGYGEGAARQLSFVRRFKRTLIYSVRIFD